MTPLLIGKQEDIMKRSEELKVNIEKCKVVDPLNYKKSDDMADEFVKIRKGKATKEQAKEILRTENYIGTMLVYMDEAHGLVSGAVHSKSVTCRPVFQIIKTRQGNNKTSAVVIMVRGEERYVRGDCAINIAPTSDDLAEIAVESSKTAKVF